MKAIITFLFFIVLTVCLVASENSLYVEFSGDTVKIWNKVQLNCCSLIKFDIEVTDNKIKLIEIDTSKVWCKCICNFNLCASLAGLKPEYYEVEVFRKLPLFISPDSIFYVGSLEFNYSPDFQFIPYQSRCLGNIESPGTTENDLIIKDDSLFIEFSSDTVKVWNTNVLANCCAIFKIDIELNNTKIKITEIDTTEDLCDCICKFDLCATLTGLQSSHYNVDIYRSFPKVYGDTSYYVGSIDFNYSPPSRSPKLVKSYQSECLHTNPDETIIYSNSFESPQDTSGWNGYMDFRSDVPSVGGKQSLYISGGCMWPHAWTELDTLDEDGYYILKCWGKDLDIGGIVYIEAEGNFQNQVNITINNKEWTYYESEDTLYCPAGKRIVLAMGAGGIVPSAMLVDLIEIVKLNYITTGLENKDNDVVQMFNLSQNYPNPFNPTTKIEFRIADFGYVSLKVYDILGNEVASLVNGEKPAGSYEIEFDGSNLSSGVYFYSLKTENYSEMKKMIILR